jgi:hypothetical protein
LPQGFALRELRISEDEMELRLRQLALLLPDIAAKISVMKPQVPLTTPLKALQVRHTVSAMECTTPTRLCAQAVAYFAADTNRLAMGLVRLKQILPSADVSSMVVKQPALLLERTPEQLAAAVEQLRQLLPRFDIDWYAYLRAMGYAVPTQDVAHILQMQQP